MKLIGVPGILERVEDVSRCFPPAGSFELFDSAFATPRTSLTFSSFARESFKDAYTGVLPMW